MLGKTSLLVVLFLAVTVHSNDSPISDERFKEMADVAASMCDDFLEMARQGRGDCYVDYLTIECACVGDALRNLTGSVEKNDTKVVVDPVAEGCKMENRNSQKNKDFLVKALKKEHEFCGITPEHKMVVNRAALKHCTNTCPVRNAK